jgi:hypothetical protein
MPSIEIPANDLQDALLYWLKERHEAHALRKTGKRWITVEVETSKYCIEVTVEGDTYAYAWPQALRLWLASKEGGEPDPLAG